MLHMRYITECTYCKDCLAAMHETVYAFCSLIQTTNQTSLKPKAFFLPTNDQLLACYFYSNTVWNHLHKCVIYILYLHYRHISCDLMIQFGADCSMVLVCVYSMC